METNTYWLPRTNNKPVYAYADDLTVVVPNERLVENLLDRLKCYGRKSGAEINENKSALLYIGDLKPSRDLGMPVVKTVKILAITFGENGIINDAWNEKEREIRSLIKELRELGAPMAARVQMIKTLVLSKCWHLGTAYPPELEEARRIEKMCYRFIWDEKPEFLARDKMKLTVDKVGCGVPDLKQYADACNAKVTSDRISGEGIGTALAEFWLGLKKRLFTRERVDLLGPLSEKKTRAI